MRDELCLDVVLSNPYHTKAIAASKKKTDKIDAHTLADLHRGGYISECHVSEEKIVDLRQLMRYRTKVVRNRAKMKNYIHSMALVHFGDQITRIHHVSNQHVIEKS